MDSVFLQNLWKLQRDFDGYPALACIWEGTITCFSKIHIPFNDALIQTFFPVPVGTKYGDGYVSKDLIEALCKLIQLPDPEHNYYEEKLNYLLNLPLSKEMFKEHSLYLLKEHCKIFSEYNDKAKELLKKLETL